MAFLTVFPALSLATGEPFVEPVPATDATKGPALVALDTSASAPRVTVHLGILQEPNQTVPEVAFNVTVHALGAVEDLHILILAPGHIEVAGQANTSIGTLGEGATVARTYVVRALLRETAEVTAQAVAVAEGLVVKEVAGFVLNFAENGAPSLSSAPAPQGPPPPSGPGSNSPQTPASGPSGDGVTSQTPPTQGGNSGGGSSAPRYAKGPVKRYEPVLLLHGLDPSQGKTGYDLYSSKRDDQGDLTKTINMLKAMGWQSPIAVGYYECDRNYSPGALIDAYGHTNLGSTSDAVNHATHLGGADSHEGNDCGGRASMHDEDTTIEHLGYHFAWYAYLSYTRWGICAKAIGHSMGGLIIRYALQQTEAGHEDFPPRLCVGHVVTFGTPHAGAAYVAAGCAMWSTQCSEMRPSSPFISKTLASNRNPQGSWGTHWTVMGSEHDALVNDQEATSNIDASRWVIYTEKIYDHGNWWTHTGPEIYWDARFRDSSDSVERFSPDLPEASRYAHYALTQHDWGCGSSKDGSTAPLALGVVTGGEPYTDTWDSCWYKLQVPAGTTQLVVDLASAPDRDLYVYSGSPDGPFICRPYTTSGYEQCKIPAPKAGTYYVRVQNYAGTVGGGGGMMPFRLVAYETNECNSGRPAGYDRAHALPIRPPAYWCGGSVESRVQPEDWYKLSVANAEFIVVGLTPSASGVTTCLVDPTGVSRLCESKGAGVPVVLQFSADRAGVWSVVVSVPALSGKSSSYAMEVHVLSVVRRDDGGASGSTKELELDYSDDLAEKRLSIPHASMHWASAALLAVYARSADCGSVSGPSLRLQMNGAEVSRVDPCKVWSPQSKVWAGLSLPVASLTSKGTTTFRLQEIAGDWRDRDLYLGMHGKSYQATTASQNWAAVSGELMWFVLLEVSRPVP